MPTCKQCDVPASLAAGAPMSTYASSGQSFGGLLRQCWMHCGTGGTAAGQVVDVQGRKAHRSGGHDAQADTSSAPPGFAPAGHDRRTRAPPADIKSCNWDLWPCHPAMPTWRSGSATPKGRPSRSASVQRWRTSRRTMRGDAASSRSAACPGGGGEGGAAGPGQRPLRTGACKRRGNSAGGRSSTGCRTMRRAKALQQVGKSTAQGGLPPQDSGQDWDRAHSGQALDGWPRAAE